jgi:hypothetical protein
LPQCRKDLDPVVAREHQIEQDKVETVFTQQEEAVLAPVRYDDLVTLCLQSVLERFRHLPFVFDDKNSHRCGLRFLSIIGALVRDATEGLLTKRSG